MTSALTKQFGILGIAQFTPYGKSAMAQTLSSGRLGDDAAIQKRASQASTGYLVHRFIKQNLGFQKCQMLSIAGQQNWPDAVLDAFISILGIKHKDKSLSWRAAQQKAAQMQLDCTVAEKNPSYGRRFVV